MSNVVLDRLYFGLCCCCLPLCTVSLDISFFLNISDANFYVVLVCVRASWLFNLNFVAFIMIKSVSCLNCDRSHK